MLAAVGCIGLCQAQQLAAKCNPSPGQRRMLKSDVKYKFIQNDDDD